MNKKIMWKKQDLTFRPESIKELIMNYDKQKDFVDGYLYKFTNLDNGRIYIGVHKGEVSDSYWNSSTDGEFNIVCSNPNSNLKLEILEYGDYDYMTLREHKILSSVDARNNKLYYNKTNGSPKYKMINQEKIDNLFTRIKAGEFRAPNRLIEEVMEIQNLQVRWFELEPNHVKYIADSIDDLMGDIMYTDPLLLFEGRGKDGDELLGNGNHTRAGINKSKHAKEAKIDLVPSSETEGFTDEDLIAIGNMMNKGDRVKKIAFQKKDAVKYLLTRYDAGVPTTFPGHLDFLKGQGLNGTEIGFAKKAADDQIEENNLAAKHLLWKKYTKSEIDNLSASYRNENTMVVAFSSAKFGYPAIFDTLTQDVNKEKKNLILVVHHTSPSKVGPWNTRIMPTAYKNLEFLLKPHGIQVHFEVLPTTIKNNISEFTK